MKRRGLSILFAAVCGAALLSSPAHAVDTGVPPLFQGTIGGPSHAQIYPSGVEVAPNGNVIVADTGNNQVVAYNPTTGAQVWRTGSFGVLAGQFNNPRDVGVDSANNVYVADPMNNRIAKLDSGGNWVSSFSGPEGDTISSPIGVTVREVKPFGGGALVERVLVADPGHRKVRIFDTDGVLQQSLVTEGACLVTEVRDADADANGIVYVANYRSNNILKMDPSDGTCVTTWGTAGTGNGQFSAPYGVSVGFDPVTGAESVYVADSNNNRVQQFTRNGVWQSSFGTGTLDPTTPNTLLQLRRAVVAHDGTGDVWAADLWGWRIERFHHSFGNSAYAVNKTIGAPLPAATASEAFHEVRGVAVESNGNLDVVDTVHHRFIRMSPSGAILKVCGARPERGLNWPRGAAIDSATGDLWIANTKSHGIQVFNPTNCVQRKGIFGGFGTADNLFNWPMDVAIRNSDKTAWIVDTYNSRIKVYDVPTRTLIKIYGSKGKATPDHFQRPSGIAVSPTGQILVADTLNNRIVGLNDDVRNTGVVSFAWTVRNTFLKPMDVAADNSGRIYVADTGKNRVVVLNPSRTTLATFQSPSGFYSPEFIAVDANGRVLVSDSYNDRIQTYKY